VFLINSRFFLFSDNLFLISHSFFRSYGAILPSSFNIVILTF